MVSKDPNMSKQRAPGKTKHVTLTASHKLQIIRTSDRGKKLQCGYGITQRWIINYIHVSFYAISLQYIYKIYTTFLIYAIIFSLLQFGIDDMQSFLV